MDTTERELRAEQAINQMPNRDAVIVAMHFAEVFQAHYPRKPLWEMMHDLAQAIDNIRPRPSVHSAPEGKRLTDEMFDELAKAFYGDGVGFLKFDRAILMERVSRVITPSPK